MPRTYRGRDIYRWLATIGQLDERYDDVDDIELARRDASVQLVGGPTRTTLDRRFCGGVELVGRLMRVAGLRAAALRRVWRPDGERGAETVPPPPADRRICHRAWPFGRGPQPDRPAPTRLGAVPTELDLERFTTA